MTVFYGYKRERPRNLNVEVHVYGSDDEWPTVVVSDYVCARH